MEDVAKNCRRQSDDLPAGKRQGPFLMAAALPLVISVLLFADTQRGDQGTQFSANEIDGVWRVPEADSLNCLYVLLRYQGVVVRYEDLRVALASVRTNGTTSLLDLRAAASVYGVELTTIKCAPGRELYLYSRLPMITLVHEARSHRNGYVLLLGEDDRQHTYLMHGANASLGRLSNEEFRRRWIGVGLTLARPRSFSLPFVITVLMNGLLALGATIWRVKARRAERYTDCDRRT